MTLPRQSRLSGKAEFSRIFQQAVVSADPSFKILARVVEQGETPDRVQQGCRLGMAVSRQVDKRAVQRNRLKRIIRESFKAHYLAGNAGSVTRPADFVVLPRSQAVTISNQQLFGQLSRLWAKIDQRLNTVAFEPNAN